MYFVITSRSSGCGWGRPLAAARNEEEVVSFAKKNFVKEGYTNVKIVRRLERAYPSDEDYVEIEISADKADGTTVGSLYEVYQAVDASDYVGDNGNLADFFKG